MAHRRQSGIVPHQRLKQSYGGTRWLKAAALLANRYRMRRRSPVMAMQWQRCFARVHWLQERRFHFYEPPQWQLNLGLDINLHDRPPLEASYCDVTESALPGLTRGPAIAKRYFKQNSVTHQGKEPHVVYPRLSNHFVMQRFVTQQTSVVLPQLRTLCERVVHTAFRPVVREIPRSDERKFQRPAEEQAPKQDSSRREQIAFSPQGTSAPAAVPIRTPEVNVSQIADQVMRLMDHRISSWRERRGRS